MTNKEILAASIERYQALNNNNLCQAHFQRFFEHCPAAEVLFPNDNGLTHHQMQKEVLKVILDAAAEKFTFLDGHLGSEMIKHEAYDVEPEMFELMLKSLLEVMQQGLVEEWPDELDQVWQAAVANTLNIIKSYI